MINMYELWDSEKLAYMDGSSEPISYYLTPISPLFTKSLKNSFIRVNRKSLKTRPNFLTKNLKRLDDNS